MPRPFAVHGPTTSKRVHQILSPCSAGPISRLELTETTIAIALSLLELANQPQLKLAESPAEQAVFRPHGLTKPADMRADEHARRGSATRRSPPDMRPTCREEAHRRRSARSTASATAAGLFSRSPISKFENGASSSPQPTRRNHPSKSPAGPPRAARPTSLT